MPAFHADSTILIDANIERVRSTLTDFKTWPVWSPWIYVEPDARIDYFGTAGKVGAGNSWVGQKIGEGQISLSNIEPNRLDCKLEFIKPFKSVADVYFDLSAIGDNSTQVTWGMNSSLPFFMFWMTGKMSAMITSDYRRGLLLLKDYLETDAIPSKSCFDGIVNMPAANYIGLHDKCVMTELSDTMSEQFATLAAATDNMQPNGVFTIYNRMDIQASTADYTAAIEVGDGSTAEAPMVKGTRAPCKALKITHTGPYRHLGNGWSKAITEQRHGKYKMVSQAPPFEVYVSDPDKTPENELITEIYIPIK